VNFGSKLGIDATTKWKEEGFTRELQNVVSADSATKVLVDKKWNNYNIS
jgi:4-hydroxy-3-polyprenylbenzoate decarboxylase